MRLASANGVVIFNKTSCSSCDFVISLITELKVSPTIQNFDLDPETGKWENTHEADAQ